MQSQNTSPSDINTPHIEIEDTENHTPEVYGKVAGQAKKKIDKAIEEIR